MNRIILATFVLALVATVPSLAQGQSQGIALCIGLNRVDPGHYNGWSGQLIACENDAKGMAAIAQSKGFRTTIMLNNQATRTAILNFIRDAASKLGKDDILMISYSGHGGQSNDINGDETPGDGMDESWCLYDGQLIDDELYEVWRKFPKGCRILVFSDSCHSGSVTKATYQDFSTKPSPARLMQLEESFKKEAAESKRGAIRAMPTAVAIRTYQKNKDFYDQLQRNLRGEKEPIDASVLLISACMDSEYASDGEQNGVFTGALKNRLEQQSIHRKLCDIS